jgi:protein phosphatase PTC1
LSDALVEEPIAIEEDDSPELAATENPAEAAAAATSAAQESTSAAQESKPESKEPADA